MVRLAAKAHFDRMHLNWLHLESAHFDRDMLARLNSVMLVGAIGSGLVACATGALIFDFGRLVGAW